jgi:cold-inducible RNA-binding protein
MKSLFVGNMSFQTSESELRELFAPFGQVTRVHMAMDRETGRARGFAFVEMPNDAEAAQAMTALDGKEVGGRNLKVNEARPKGEGGAPRGPEGAGPVVVAAARVAADATVFRTKITVSQRASRANRAGSFPFHGWAGRQGPGPSPHSAVRRGL